jgi:hypothetical protein
MGTQSYLHIRGTLVDEWHYIARDGYESERAGARHRGDPQFQLVLCACDGTDIYSIAPQVIDRCSGVEHSRRSRVRGVLPYLDEAVAYELRRAGRTVYRREIPAQPPPAPNVLVHKHEDGLTLHLQVERQNWPSSYSVIAQGESGKRYTIARTRDSMLAEIETSSIPLSGTATILVAIHDGVRSTEVEVAKLDVPERPDMALILSPDENQTLPFGQPVSVLGCYLNAAGEPQSADAMEWFLDGERLSRATAIVATEALAPGRHRLTLVCGSARDRVECSVCFVVEEPEHSDHEWMQLVGDLGGADGTDREPCD